MIFHKSDRENLEKIIIMLEGAQQQMLNIRVDDVQDIINNLKKIGFVIGQIYDKIDVLECKLKSLEKEPVQYKLATPQKTHKKK